LKKILPFEFNGEIICAPERVFHPEVFPQHHGFTKLDRMSM